jgi:hypothetical protein
LLSLAVLALLTSISAPTIAQTSNSAGSVRIHYLRKNADYAGWTIYTGQEPKIPALVGKIPVLHRL